MVEMQRVFFILYVAAATFAQDFKVHEQMTAEEVLKTFGTNHASVPDYEVIPVSHGFHKKSRIHRIVQFKSFNVSMTLYLEPTDGYFAGDETPVYTATSSESGIKYEKIPNGIKSKNTQLFQDPIQLASLLIRPAKDGKILVEGIIDKFAIRPLPERFHSQFKRDKRAAAGPDEYLQSNQTVYHSNLEDTHHHVVFKIPSAEGQPKQKKGRVANRAGKAKPKRNNVPQTVHPQMLLILESDLFNIFNKNIDDAVCYILSFWNAADLRYRVFKNPKVRLNIAGIILANDSRVTKYIKKNHVKVTEKLNNKIQAHKALDDYANFMYTNTTYNQENNILTFTPLNLDYDLTVTMTPFDMCEFKPDCMREGRYSCALSNLTSNCETLGLAYHTGACSYDSTDDVMEAVAIIEDTGAFGGIIPAAHEVGHLLGASHQEDNRFDCAKADGYIMSYELVVTEKTFMWSQCSVLSIQDFFKKESRVQCLFNQPNIGSKVDRVLPGKIFSRNEQCTRLMYFGNCDDPQQVARCDTLQCWSTIGCTNSQYPIAEGTECGDGKYCINAKCVDVEAMNIELEVGTAPPTTVRTTTENGKYVEVDYVKLPELELSRGQSSNWSDEPGNSSSVPRTVRQAEATATGTTTTTTTAASASASSSCTKGLRIGVYGWRKRCLYFLVLGLTVIVILNLALTLWLLRVMQFSFEGIGSLKVIPGGVELRGQATVLDALIASSVRSRRGSNLVLESWANFTASARSESGQVLARFTLTEDKVECVSRAFRITDTTGELLFSATRDSVVVGAKTLKVTGFGGAVFDGSIQTPLVSSEAGRNLRLESVTRSLEVRAPQRLSVESSAGGIYASCLSHLKLHSQQGAVTLDSRAVFLKGLLPTRLTSSSSSKKQQQQNAKNAGVAVYQLCACADGKLFLAPPDGICQADGSVC